MKMIRYLVLSAVFLCAFSPIRLWAGEADQKYIRLAFKMALTAVEQGNDPFGAVLVKDGHIIAQAANSVKTDNNVTHHAETDALAMAYRRLGPKSIKHCTLYASCEPCAMCCGAIFMSGVGRLVYGLSAEKLSAMTGFQKVFPCRAFFRAAGAQIEITGPLLEKEAAEAIKRYLDRRKMEGSGPATPK
jgi:tRNA(Arg) A34 adenosine deaminase TadA